VPKWLEINYDNVHTQFLALNADFSNSNLDTYVQGGMRTWVLIVQVPTP